MAVAPGVAADAIVAALAAVGVPGTDNRSAATSGRAADVSVDVNGVAVNLQLKTASTVTPDSLRRWWAADREVSHDAVVVVVADRVLPAARTLLEHHGWGWLDLRGHLRFAAPGVLVDADVPPLERLRGPTDPFGGAVGVEIACALLLDPDEPMRVRPLARNLGRSPSSVSAAADRLRQQQLLTSGNTAAIPELFWAVAGVWKPVAVSVARTPVADDPVVMTALRTGWGLPTATVRWVLTDTLAASAYGAPIGISSDYPPCFYVPDEAVARRAEALLGVPSTNRSPAATVRVAPVPQVCSLWDGPLFSGKPWPLAHPVFVALDLAADPGRGTEVLDGWTPPEGTARVW